MREIKFRGLGVDGKWWFGESNPSGENHINLATFFANIHAGAIRPETVGEWTGLRDKNGREIWEGDIVHTFSRVGRGFRDRGVDKVHYSDITARWYPLDIVVTEMCEVIGDIYSNPELIKEVK